VISNRRLARQLAYHSERLAQATTPRARLAIATEWLVAEGVRGGPEVLAQLTEQVLVLVRERRDANAPEQRRDQETEAA